MVNVVKSCQRLGVSGTQITQPSRPVVTRKKPQVSRHRTRPRMLRSIRPDVRNALASRKADPRPFRNGVDQAVVPPALILRRRSRSERGRSRAARVWACPLVTSAAKRPQAILC